MELTQGQPSTPTHAVRLPDIWNFIDILHKSEYRGYGWLRLGLHGGIGCQILRRGGCFPGARHLES
jgi:hypothetical protein